MPIRIRTFEGCPNCEATRDLVEKTMRELNLRVVIDAIRVNNEDEAKKYGFIGSGKTLSWAGETRTPHFPAAFMAHRTESLGVPPKQLAVNALKEAQRDSIGPCSKREQDNQT